MTNHSWVEEFPGAATVCDPNGVVLEMNQKAAENFKDDGGLKLIGKSLFDCHPEPSRTKLKELLERKQVNVYTTEKGGVHELIYQAPWYRNGKYSGFVELSFAVPSVIPHFIRD